MTPVCGRPNLQALGGARHAARVIPTNLVCKLHVLEASLSRPFRTFQGSEVVIKIKMVMTYELSCCELLYHHRCGYKQNAGHDLDIIISTVFSCHFWCSLGSGHEGGSLGTAWEWDLKKSLWSTVVFFETSHLSILFFFVAVGSVQECVVVHIGTWYGLVIRRSVKVCWSLTHVWLS